MKSRISLSAKTPKYLRLFFSEQCPLFQQIFAGVVHGAAGVPLTLITTFPPSIDEEDVLETAMTHDFDLAILILNNIRYRSGDRSRLAQDGIEFVRVMCATFDKPIIAVYGYPQDPRLFHSARLIRAGAVDAFPLPFNTEEVQKVIKRCLHID